MMTAAIMKNNPCPVCGTEIIGRKDKKFCSAKCKSIDQYERKQIEEEFYLKVDKQLKINRKILKKYNQTGFTTLRKQELLAQGFNPKVFTHYWKNREGQVYLFVYDFGFLDIKKDGKEKYLIVQWQDYMGKLIP